MRFPALPTLIAVLALLGGVRVHAQPTPRTVALWLFDEQQGLYPSSVLNDASGDENVLVLGRGGRIVEGRFGNALEVAAPEPLDIPEGTAEFGLSPLAPPPGRTVAPLTWHNADFAALMTSGERHLRKEVDVVNPTATALNLGASSWTVEFWYRAADKRGGEGTVLEIGTGPRGENDVVTRLSLGGDRSRLVNQPSGADVTVASDGAALDSGAWHHYAFVYDACAGQLRHYVDGRPAGEPVSVRLRALPEGDDAYVSVGRDGTWGRPLAGALDELRVSEGQVYDGAFEVPGSFAEAREPYTLAAGPPLLFRSESVGEVPAGTLTFDTDEVVEVGRRKHLFIDDALVAARDGVTFVANPPRLAEKVIDAEAAPRAEAPHRRRGRGRADPPLRRCRRRLPRRLDQPRRGPLRHARPRPRA